MTIAAPYRWRARPIHAAALIVLIHSAPCLAQAPEGTDLSIELVDPKVFRACADPHDLPFSNEAGEGFENKVAELLAKKLGKGLAYAWYPQSVGFIRNTLNAHRCDVILGFPQGGELAQSTNPYYRTAYALVFKRHTGFDAVETLSDERLKGKRIGIVAGTPPATYLAMNGLMGTAKPYPLVIDTRVDSSAEAMMKDLADGAIDVGVLWGPMAGYHAKQLGADVAVIPLTRETGGPQMAYRIAMGVRPADREWKRLLDRLVRENQGEINGILTGYGVPLLDDNDRPLPQPATK
jgi:quinoprotein dehydrogenase-associated probable ABC transporter substrate-binding protein